MIAHLLQVYWALPIRKVEGTGLIPVELAILKRAHLSSFLLASVPPPYFRGKAHNK